MPLHCHYESFSPSIFETLHQSIGSPGSRDKILSDCFDSLMMMTIDDGLLRASQLRHPAAIQQGHDMGRSIARRSLLVLDGIRHFCRYVLDQGPTAMNVQRLHTKTNCEQRQV